MKVEQLHEAGYAGSSGPQTFVIYNTKVKKFAQNSDTLIGFRLRNQLNGNVSFYKSRKDAQQFIDEWKWMINDRMIDRNAHAHIRDAYNKLGKALTIVDYFIVAPVTIHLP